MGFQRNPESGRQAVLWLATAVILLIGAAGCAFIIVVAVENPAQHLVIWGALFGGFCVALVWSSLPRDRNYSKRWLGLWLASRDRSAARNVLRIGRKPKSVNTQFGNNAPPSVESVRDAAELNVSWVPHGPQPTRERPPR